jgi:hypothetical protein
MTINYLEIGHDCLFPHAYIITIEDCLSFPQIFHIYSGLISALKYDKSASLQYLNTIHNHLPVSFEDISCANEVTVLNNLRSVEQKIK